MKPKKNAKNDANEKIIKIKEYKRKKNKETKSKEKKNINDKNTKQKNLMEKAENNKKKMNNQNEVKENNKNVKEKKIIDENQKIKIISNKRVQHISQKNNKKNNKGENIDKKETYNKNCKIFENLEIIHLPNIFDNKSKVNNENNNKNNKNLFNNLVNEKNDGEEEPIKIINNIKNNNNQNSTNNKLILGDYDFSNIENKKENKNNIINLINLKYLEIQKIYVNQLNKNIENIIKVLTLIIKKKLNILFVNNLLKENQIKLLGKKFKRYKENFNDNIQKDNMIFKSENYSISKKILNYNFIKRLKYIIVSFNKNDEKILNYNEENLDENFDKSFSNDMKLKLYLYNFILNNGNYSWTIDVKCINNWFCVGIIEMQKKMLYGPVIKTITIDSFLGITFYVYSNNNYIIYKNDIKCDIIKTKGIVDINKGDLKLSYIPNKQELIIENEFGEMSVMKIIINKKKMLLPCFISKNDKENIRFKNFLNINNI